MDPDALRIELIESICRLPPEKLQPAADALRRLTLAEACASAPMTAKAPQPASSARDWPHAPLHRLSEQGTCMVTSATFHKADIFCDRDRLDVLEAALLNLARKYDFQLEAWAVFSNHYHFVGHTQRSPSRLRAFLTELHADTARHVNRLDGQMGRKVWHNFWDKQLTFEKSYLARLNYVHQNAVRQGLVRVANQYPWCSAAWFERTATPAQIRTIYGFKTDRIRIDDEFEPLNVSLERGDSPQV
ncbi:MAG: transposase [Planctomycetaceae bacterium]